jgi:hypothetical protein
MASPVRWTNQQLRDDAEAAKALFRTQRLDEPAELYSQFFGIFAPIFHELIGNLPDLKAAELDPELLPELVRNSDRRTAFRYMAAPPISDDDLKTLAETTLSAKALRANPDQAKRVRDVVLHILDPHRFPWIVEDRAPAGHEIEQAVVASAALVAAKKVETGRRSDAKDVQEARVKDLLRGMGFEEVPPRDIPLLDAAPAPGQFCGESKLGDTRADIVIRLYDRRALPIECKVSNSAVNSFKRVNHEAAGKAAAWLRAFGDRATVPSAVLSGVFGPGNLDTAQASGLFLFWAHRLQDLADFIESTKP